MWRRNSRMRQAAVEGVLLETRLTMAGTFEALAGVLAGVPDIAGRLRAAAEMVAQAPVTEDPDHPGHISASRTEIVAILQGMARVVDANHDKGGRTIPKPGAGLQ